MMPLRASSEPGRALIVSWVQVHLPQLLQNQQERLCCLSAAHFLPLPLVPTHTDCVFNIHLLVLGAFPLWSLFEHFFTRSVWSSWPPLTTRPCRDLASLLCPDSVTLSLCDTSLKTQYFSLPLSGFSKESYLCTALKEMMKKKNSFWILSWRSQTKKTFSLMSVSERHRN